MKPPMKCGLEIHQQLETHKLFCCCSGQLSEEFATSFTRRLRPTQSEMGDVDRAALMEASRKLLFRYMAPPSTCLVEADEEPPHPLNREALETVLLLSKMVNATPVEEVHFMRKIVIDGSNTTGFQRTALVARDGFIEVDGKKISIQTICLEEDAARPLERKDGEAVYNLDRLGVPLIEIATGPDIDTPEMARKTAEHIGMLLRATGRVRRGIGTIREDLNVSIPGGARIEAKGVQELRLLAAYVEDEVARQQRLLEARKILLERGAKPADQMSDVSALLGGTGSKVIRRALEAGGRAMALALKGYAGLLGPFHDGKKCLGPEFAAYARTAGVGGLFHTDELPAYGVTEEEVLSLRKNLGLGQEDAFVLVAAKPDVAAMALERVRARAFVALEGVPEETRDPLPDGTTRYSRPLPGGARMYPETDVPPVAITLEDMHRMEKMLPEMPWEKKERISEQYGLGEEQSKQLVTTGMDVVFEVLAETYPDIPRGFLSSLCTANVENDTLLGNIIELVARGGIAKEAAQSIIDTAKEHGMAVEDAVEKLGLGGVDEGEVRETIKMLVEERGAFVKERGDGAVGPLMGMVMKEYRGKIDGGRINQMLREAVDKYLKAQ